MFKRVLFGALALLLVAPLQAFAIQTRIVGGVPSTPGAYPFMAAILDSSGDPTTQFCGGSLIHANWVVSAAHCFREENGSNTPAANVKVGLGLYQLSAGGGQIFSVKRIIVHPNYNSTTSDYDMALLELNGTATEAPVTTYKGTSDLVGTDATAIGWGLTIPNDNNSNSDILRQVTIPVVSNTTCNVPYGGGITARMVCAGLSQGGKDTCQGDSGGPLVATIGGITQLIGLTSFGEGCAQPGVYGVYARLNQFQSFISQYVSLGNPLVPANGKYGMWNGYLGMKNIVELTNRSSQAVTAQVNVIGADGTLMSTNYFSVGAGLQTDVELNQLTGFQTDAYGIIQVSNNIDGRVLFYRPTSAAFTDFEYAFAISLLDGITGSSEVGFNTYNPTFNPGELGYAVFNWLSIVNLSDTTQSFTVKKYDENGALLSQSLVTVNAKSRSDFEGGHASPGASHIGLIEVVPSSGSAQYVALVTRYGANSPTGYAFAFPLLASAGSTNQIAVELGSSAVAKNYLEVINASASPNTVALSYYNAAGALVAQQSLPLAGHSQQHIEINQILGDQATGYARIQTSSSLPVIAESMFYFRDVASGSITAMYGAQANPPVQGSAQGSYNRYIGMEDYVKFSNPNDVAVIVDMTVMSFSSAGSSMTVTMAPNTSYEFGLNDPMFGTVADSYGTVTLAPRDASKKLIHEVLRVKHSSAGELEFTAPTSLN